MKFSFRGACETAMGILFVASAATLAWVVKKNDENVKGKER